jgi:hypothetical protein
MKAPLNCENLRLFLLKDALNKVSSTENPTKEILDLPLKISKMNNIDLLSKFISCQFDSSGVNGLNFELKSNMKTLGVNDLNELFNYNFENIEEIKSDANRYIAARTEQLENEKKNQLSKLNKTKILESVSNLKFISTKRKTSFKILDSNPIEDFKVPKA